MPSSLFRINYEIKRDVSTMSKFIYFQRPVDNGGFSHTGLSPETGSDYVNKYERERHKVSL